MKTTIINKREHLENYPCLTFVWKKFLFWKLSQHKREELLCLIPHDSFLFHFAGEKHVFQHLSFQQMLPSTSCACSFGKENSSVSVGAAPCFVFDHTEEMELEGGGLIWNRVGCARREQLGRRSIFHSWNFVWNIWGQLGATFSSWWAGTWEPALRFIQDRESGLKLFFFGVLVLLPFSCDLVHLPVKGVTRTHKRWLSHWVWLWAGSLAEGRAKPRFLSYRKTVVHNNEGKTAKCGKFGE